MRGELSLQRGESMSNGLIFISYRREDAAGYARAIYDRVARHFSEERVFMDVDAIQPGLPFDEAIEKAVGQCEILLALIGRNWLTQGTGAGPRINDPKDYVRMEIATALSRNVRVIPVLLDGAKMPNEEELPEPLRALSRRHAIEMSHSSFKSDVEGLISAVRNALREPVVPSKASDTAISQLLPWWRSFAVYSIVGVLAAGALALIIYAYKKPPSPTYRKLSPTPNPAVSSPSRSSASEESGKESEPNNTAPTANPILFGSRVQGVAEKESLDFFTFKTPSDVQGKTRVILRKLSSAGFRAAVTIYDSNERVILDDSDWGSRPVSLVFDSTPGSTYFVSVQAYYGTPPYEYELEIRAD
jgi:TIR domain